MSLILSIAIIIKSFNNSRVQDKLLQLARNLLIDLEERQIVTDNGTSTKVQVRLLESQDRLQLFTEAWAMELMQAWAVSFLATSQVAAC